MYPSRMWELKSTGGQSLGAKKKIYLYIYTKIMIKLPWAKKQRMLFETVWLFLHVWLAEASVFQLTQSSRLKTWLTTRRSPPLCFSPAASAQAPPMLLLLVWCYFRPPCPLFLLLLFLPHLPSHSWCPGTLACMHARILSLSLHSHIFGFSQT